MLLFSHNKWIFAGRFILPAQHSECRLRKFPLTRIVHGKLSKWDWLRSKSNPQKNLQRVGSVPVPFAMCAMRAKSIPNEQIS